MLRVAADLAGEILAELGDVDAEFLEDGDDDALVLVEQRAQEMQVLDDGVAVLAGQVPTDLKDKAIRIRGALQARGVVGDDGAAVDNVQLFSPPRRQDADSRNFVLFPGDSFDRSPCGTGTSARMATLHARGLLRLGQPWRQESVTGSLFTGWLTRDHERLIPHIRGRAFVTGKGTLLFDAADDLRGGLRAD